jgi:hypothetical protein
MEDIEQNSDDINRVHIKKRRIESNEDELFNDEEDADDEQFVSMHVSDIMNYLRHKEIERSPSPQALAHSSHFDAFVRGYMVDYMVKLTTTMKCLNDTLHLSVAILDALISKGYALDNKDRLSCTCFLIACKFEEIYPPEADEMAQLCNCDRKDIVAVEKDVLNVLDYKLCLPNACQFLRRFSRVTNSNDDHHFVSKYLIELAFLHAEWFQYLPSQFSAGCVFLAHIFLSKPMNHCDSLKELTKSHLKWVKSLLWHSKHPLFLIRDCCRLLLNWYNCAGSNTILTSSYEKFTRFNKSFISKLNIPSAEKLDQLFLHIEHLLT